MNVRTAEHKERIELTRDDHPGCLMSGFLLVNRYVILPGQNKMSEIQIENWFKHSSVGITISALNSCLLFGYLFCLAHI